MDFAMLFSVVVVDDMICSKESLAYLSQRILDNFRDEVSYKKQQQAKTKIISPYLYRRTMQRAWLLASSAASTASTARASAANAVAAAASWFGDGTCPGFQLQGTTMGGCKLRTRWSFQIKI
jgi:hypothetical protein